MSLFGGLAVIPHRKIFSIKKASAALKTDPILFKLLIFSSIIVRGVFFESLNSLFVFLINSLFF